MRTRSSAVMVTRRCNMKCAHCSVESHPKIKGEPTEEELRALVDGLIEAGVRSIQFTGGEPMLRGPLVLELMARANERGVKSSLVSNGFWGKKPEVAEKTLDDLRAAGLARLAISYDRFHAEFQGPEPVLNIVRAAQRRDWPIHINITRTLDDSDLDQIVAPFHGQTHALLRFYDIQPVGSAKSLGAELRAQLDGFCSSCEQATFTDNGRVIACNGPAYFEKMSSGLVTGEYATGKTSISELLDLHGSDPILQTIRTEGPAKLRDILESLPGFENFPFRESYSGMCELCLDINRDAKAVAALRQHLSLPEEAAVLVAKRRVRDQARLYTHNRDGANERYGPAGLLAVLVGTADAETEKMLGRADLDWHRLMERLEAAGLLHLFAAHRQNPLLTRWAPHFFWKAAEAAQASVAEVLIGRREELRLAMEAAREAGFEVRPAGSSVVLEQGGKRVPEGVELLTTGNRASLEALLEARLGLPYPVKIRQVPNHLEVASPMDTARELLADWRDRFYTDGMGLVWDLHTLAPDVALQSLLQHHEPGQLVSTQAACQVLSKELGLPLASEGADWPRSFRFALALKVINFQMYRDVRRRTNLLLGPALPLLTLQSPRYFATALMRGGKRFITDLERLAKEHGLRFTLEIVKGDVREAWIASGLEKKWRHGR